MKEGDILVAKKNLVAKDSDLNIGEYGYKPNQIILTKGKGYEIYVIVSNLSYFI